MTTVIVRDIEIGKGRPKICVPIVGRSKETILEAASKLHELPVDVVEWRADWFDGVDDRAQVLDLLKDLRKALGKLPLLMTFRTAAEGGEKAISPEDYAALNIAAAQSGHIDLVDVEAYIDAETVSHIIREAHAAGVYVVASNHDFDATPSKEEILTRLRYMQDLGADLPKIAVMPRNARDVITLLDATEEMYTCYADRPVITMSMAGQGVISRLSGEIFGSALSFGAAGQTSAPGQMDVSHLDQILSLIHDAL